VKTTCCNAAISYNLALCLGQEKDHNDEIGSCENDKEPKDPAPTKVFCQGTGNDGPEARRGAPASEMLATAWILLTTRYQRETYKKTKVPT